MIGRILAGRYRVVAPIGEGGMSRVWRAVDQNTGRMVAVKVLREEFRDDETFVRRFEREAQAASRMTHPNIVGLLDVGLEEDGTRYLVIEYVSGKTLKQFIQESESIRPETAAQIIIRVLAAVQHAHQNGVIHRDIKPQNILIDREGAVKVSDFGIARLANSQTMNQESETVMGSVYYFSPEQAKGGEVDEKSDLYSVGVVFYELLTGRVPFTGDSPVAIAMQHLQDKPVPPSELNPAVSPALDFVVMHAMEKRPRHRYATAADMLRDVRLALEHPDTILAARSEAERREQEARARARRREKAERRVKWMRRTLVVTFTLLLLIVMALAGYAVMDRVLIARRNTVEVPSVIGMNRNDADVLLKELGLDPNYRFDYYDLVPENVVADQSILPGTFVAPGEKITIVVCRSNYEVRVPNVMNIPYEDALSLLDNAGIVVSKVEQAVSLAEYNLVISQSREPGSAANRGDTIELIVSGGSVTMPRLVDSTQAQAEQTVIALNLRLNIEEQLVDDPTLVGKVVEQVPEPYRQVRRNSTVTIHIGIPDSTFYSGQITLDLSDLPENTNVMVELEQEDGSVSTPFIQFFDTAPGMVSVTVFSKTAREGVYHVYYNDTLHDTDSVTFTR